MDYETLTYRKEEGLGIITLNRPERKNALSPQLMLELDQLLAEIALDDEVRVVVITGNAECFSSGADLKERPKASPEVRQRTRGLFDRIEAFEKPTIAAISGWCLAGGLELAMACDIRIVSETARLGDRHVQIGVIGGGGATARLPRLVGLAKAKELIFTGDPVDGREAQRIGLVNQVFSQEDYLEEALKLARRIAQMPPRVVRMAKKAIDTGYSMGRPEAVQVANLCAESLRASGERAEGVAAFLEKRAPRFKQAGEGG